VLTTMITNAVRTLPYHQASCAHNLSHSVHEPTS
jgi:hypothetical protein